jgi:hypothetical protein
MISAIKLKEAEIENQKKAIQLIRYWMVEPFWLIGIAVFSLALILVNKRNEMNCLQG